MWRDVLLVLLAAGCGWGGATLNNRRSGLQNSTRDDRKAVLDTYLPQLWDLHFAHLRWRGTERADDCGPLQLVVDDTEHAGPHGRPRVEPEPMGAVADHVWRHLQRTTSRDRTMWQRYAAYLKTHAENLDMFELQHREFERYLLRQFSPLTVRPFRWWADRMRYRKALRSAVGGESPSAWPDGNYGLSAPPDSGR